VRRKEISGDCGVPYLANRPALEVAFDAEHQLAHLVIMGLRGIEWVNLRA